MTETILDDFANTNALSSVDPRLKVALSIGAILISVSSTSPVAPAFVAATMGLATVLLAKIPLSFYLRALLAPLLFIVTGGAVILFVTGSGDPLFSVPLSVVTLTATRDAANLTILVAARALGGICSLFFIALTTPLIEIFSLLRSAGLPREFVDLSMLVYRSIFVLIGEAIAIGNAQVMRQGYTTFRNSISALSMLGSMLFVRAWERGEDLILAMDARCYDGRLELLENERRISIRGTLLVIGYLAGAAALMVGTASLEVL
ncbi:MAG: cobalt ECF transporter T component CbiQ [Methanomicrobiales archaeon]|nr:cobalt ECF transporter T component CbiQ [Methanomicrobiales archaeon]MDI6876435.1 cobalt ECF transporter T component CbiQ [Methanomicrobiales archaeon]